jgi:hypothetical protein
MHWLAPEIHSRQSVGSTPSRGRAERARLHRRSQIGRLAHRKFPLIEQDPGSARRRSVAFTSTVFAQFTVRKFEPRQRLCRNGAHAGHLEFSPAGLKYLVNTAKMPDEFADA